MYTADAHNCVCQAGGQGLPNALLQQPKREEHGAAKQCKGIPSKERLRNTAASKEERQRRFEGGQYDIYREIARARERDEMMCDDER